MRFISLGCWCGTTISLRGNNLYEEALPFDYIRSTFNGIIDCFENNYVNFLPKKIELDIIPNYHYTNKSFRGKYFGFYHHNLHDRKIINDFKRRIWRLIDILNSNTEIIFIRTIVTDDYNEEINLTDKFINVIRLKYPNLKFIIIFIIPNQETTQYYKNINNNINNNKVYIFTLNDKSNINDNLKDEYKPIYDFILNNDLFNIIPENNNDIVVNNNIKNKHNNINGISIVRNDN
jgi:hypothetical protein